MKRDQQNSENTYLDQWLPKINQRIINRIHPIPIRRHIVNSSLQMSKQITKEELRNLLTQYRKKVNQSVNENKS
jgi:hypothetical protein